jgi:signal recognition particle subunit SRP54
MFESLSKRLQDTFDSLGGRGIVTENDIRDAMRDVRMALLEADVSLSIVKDFVTRVRDRALGAEVHKALRPGDQVLKIVHEELVDILGEPGRLDFSGSSKPHVIMLVGLQGSGKTTTGAKLAVHLREKGRAPFLIAADTYRPAAVDQLVSLAKQVGIPYYEEGVASRPVDIVSRGLAQAKAQNAAVVIIDTAGRLQINDTLMAELVEIKRRANPAEILLVADAMTGQEAINVAQGFNEQIGVTGLILTKVDGDARGGAALSMRYITGVPIKFLGTGERIAKDTFEPFHPDRIAQRILGMGDIQSLLEKAVGEYDEQEAVEMQRKLLEEDFTLQDFLDQLRKVRKMGPIGQLLGMVPGMSRLQQQGAIDNEEMEKRLSTVEAIISSMTIEERNRPKVLNASRRKRVARGSGVQVKEVNDVIKQYRQMQDLMKQIRRGRMPNIPGLGNLGV